MVQLRKGATLRKLRRAHEHDLPSWRTQRNSVCSVNKQSDIYGLSGTADGACGIQRMPCPRHAGRLDEGMAFPLAEL
jgi:hypothetical protein